MRSPEQGFLLLTSQLGDPERRPLTTYQLRLLAERIRAADRPCEDRELEERDLIALGYGREMARRILGLLEQRELLEHYLRRGTRAGCCPLSRISEYYPSILRSRLGLDSPGCLWAKGDVSVLERPAVALVGSRDIAPDNLAFACEVGRQAAIQGFVLVSGNARGADRAAQEGCLRAGGKVISVVADELEKYPERPNVLYLSEDCFDLPFTAQRALSRNRVIHCLGQKTFVAQCGYQKGGTWHGTTQNLRSGWSPVFCFDDGSPAMNALENMGAELLESDRLHNITALNPRFFRLFDQ